MSLVLAQYRHIHTKKNFRLEVNLDLDVLNKTC